MSFTESNKQVSITNLLKQNSMSPFPSILKDASNPSLMDNNKLFNPVLFC